MSRVRGGFRTCQFSLAILLTGCGYVSQPLPPALDMPMRVTDLRVTERAGKIVADFTISPLTTEGLALKTVRSVELRAGIAPQPFTMEAWAAAAKRFEVPASAPGALHFEFPAEAWIGKDVAVAVRATGPKGRISEWSYLKTVPVRTPLETPADLKAANVEQGVALAWRGGGPRYRVFRAAGEEKPQPIGESDQSSYVDAQVDYGTHYRYYVQAIAGELQESGVSEAAPITPVDEFPPAVPAGLTAVAGVNTIELAWERNTEPDFKGYNVYRSVEDGSFQKVADLVEAPTYTDRQVEPGKKYRYAVSAVDVKGNESQRSSVQEVTAQ